VAGTVGKVKGSSDKSSATKSKLKVKSQRSQESNGKAHRPPIQLSEEEEQFRWILKPFATMED